MFSRVKIVVMPAKPPICRTLYTSCSWVTKSCLTLCNPVDYSMPGFPALHYLLEFAQTRVQWVSDAVQPCHPLSPFSSCPQSFPASGSFLPNESALLIRLPKHRSFSISPSSEYSVLISLRIDWFDLLAVQGFQESSPAPHQFTTSESISSLAYLVLSKY